MSEFRRNLLKMGGVRMNLPQWFKDHIVCWYSPKRQGATNESLSADPRLIDLSDKGMDLELVNFTFNGGMPFDGVLPDGSLSFTASDYGRTKVFGGLTSFTYIAKRQFATRELNIEQCLTAKSPQRENGFVGETYKKGSTNYVYVGKKGYEQRLLPNFNPDLSVSYMTPHMLNGIDISDKVGTFVDTDSRLLVGYIRENFDDRFFCGQLYDFFFFDTELTEEQINWVKNNLIE